MNKNLDGSDLVFEQDGRLRFEPDGHRYIIDGYKEFTPVSNVVKDCFEEFDADYWANRKAPELGISPEELKDKWKCHGEMASKAGTFMHAQIENHFNGRPMESVATLSYQSEYINLSEQVDISHELQLFRQFVEVTPLTPFRTEWTVFHEGLQIAGTIDLVCRTGSRSVAIYDWKRSEKLVNAAGDAIDVNRFNKTDRLGMGLPDTSFWHYVVQQNLYRYILEQCYGLVVDAMHLVVLHPSLKRHYVLGVPRRDDILQTVAHLLRHH